MVVSAAFAGKSRLERHRMVNAALAEELKTVHALAITALAPEERAKVSSGQEAAHSRLRKAVRAFVGTSRLHVGLADAAHEHERELAALHLLVLRHQPEELAWRRRLAGDVGDLRGQPDLGKVALDAERILLRAETLLDRIGEGEALADGDGFAMQQAVGIAGDRPRARGRKCGRD